jgi:hypothetical protein
VRHLRGAEARGSRRGEAGLARLVRVRARARARARVRVRARVGVKS